MTSGPRPASVLEPGQRLLAHLRRRRRSSGRSRRRWRSPPQAGVARPPARPSGGCQYMSQNVGRAGADHLERRRAACPSRRRRARASPRPARSSLQPLHQRQVVAEAAEQGHRRVGVAVDQRRREQHPGGVERPRRRARGATSGPSASMTSVDRAQRRPSRRRGSAPVTVSGAHAISGTTRPRSASSARRIASAPERPVLLDA